MHGTAPDTLKEEILHARNRVYKAGAMTPLQEIYNNGAPYRVFVKREDLGPINAYKWRGAYNAVATYHEKTGCKTVVAASAGNHAQGVALAAQKAQHTGKDFHAAFHAHDEADFGKTSRRRFR